MSETAVSGFERFVFAPSRAKDGKPHDEIGTIGRARATLDRARKLKAPPDWFEGTVEDYRKAVEDAVFSEHEGIEMPAAIAADSGDYFLTTQDAEFESAGKHRFRKDILSVGKLVHPATGDEHEFTEERLKALAANTNALVAKGREIYFPEGHTREARKNLGRWRDFEVEAGKLYATCTVRDPGARESIANGNLNRVSAFIKGPYTESDGTKYTEVIEHVAATPVPVNINQQDFEPVALALDRQGFSVYVEERSVAEQKKDEPKAVKLETSPEFLAALGLAADAKPEDVILAAKKMKEDASKATSFEATQTKLAAENADLSKRLATIEGAQLDSELKLAVEAGRINAKQLPLFRAIIARKETIALSIDGKAEEKPLGDLVRQIIALSTVDKTIALENAVKLPPKDGDDKDAITAGRKLWADAHKMNNQQDTIEWFDVGDGTKDWRAIKPKSANGQAMGV